jgi:oligosaccharide repeat unit polymerase
MLLAFLLLIHGPAYLVYMLFRGPQSVIYRRIAQSLNFDGIVVSLNLSIALMFIGVITGIELVDRFAPSSVRALHTAIFDWDSRPLSAGQSRPWWLLVLILGLALFMIGVSMIEHHLAVLAGYLAVGGKEVDKIVYRQQYGGSHLYVYRVLVNSIAPMLIVWGALAGWTRRWWPLLAVTALLLVATVLGKLETLSKAPIALLLIQLMLVGYLIFRNSITWRAALVAIGVALLVFYPIIRIAVPEAHGLEALSFFYYRAFDISNEAVLEFFGAYPERLPHTLGSNIHLLARILGTEYAPSFDIVSRVWRGTGGSTTTAMFIADAWADFAYAGVIVFSIAAGVICRAIDLTFLARGKTVIAVAVLAAAFMGIYNLMISALPTAMLSGGLVIAPLMAVFVILTQRKAQHSAARRAAGEASPGEA